MEKFLVLIVVLLFIYNLLKPNKKKQGKTNSNDIQDLQKMLSKLEQKKQATGTTVKKQQKNLTETTKEEYISMEKTSIEVKTYDDNITLAEFLESKKRSKEMENLEKSESYTMDEIDTYSSFEKENQKWLKQSLKDNAEHTDKHTKKSKITPKDIKKAYITSQIMEKKYV